MKNLILSLALILTLSSNAQQSPNPVKPYVGHWIAESDSDTKSELIIYTNSENEVILVEMVIDHKGGMNRGVLLATVYTHLNAKGELEIEVINPSTLDITQYTLTSVEDGKLIKIECNEITNFIKY
jgi:hypothetical protein